jgi:hypothetical protein
MRDPKKPMTEDERKRLALRNTLAPGEVSFPRRDKAKAEPPKEPKK